MGIKRQADKKIEAIRALRLWMEEQVKNETSGSLSAFNNGLCLPLIKKKQGDINR